MPLDRKELAVVTQHLLAARRQEATRLNLIYAYFRNKIIDIYVPKSATEEYRNLVDQARFNIFPLLESSIANNLFIDGFRTGNTRKNAPTWEKVWQPNRMDARQGGLWRAAVRYGMSYARLLPDPDKPAPVITPFSPRRCTALYDDVINDEWPVYALTVGTPHLERGSASRVVDIAVYDEVNEYKMTVPSAATWTAAPGEQLNPAVENFAVNTDGAKVFPHNLGVTPIVRMLSKRDDLDDGALGVVEPMLPAQRQLNQTTFGLLMAQQYAAFKQRWVTGLAVPEDDDGNPIEPFNAAVNRLFIAEDETVKFGEFTETSLDGYLSSRDKTLLYVSSVRQIPPHTMVVGNAVSNISAEALAALEAGHQQDIAECKTSLGEDAEQLLRLGAKARGDNAGWEDLSARVRWRDTTPRSLAQIADALGKLATMLGVPPRALWERIPDVTDEDLEEWDQLAKEDDMFAKLEQSLNAQPTRPRADRPAPA